MTPRQQKTVEITIKIITATATPFGAWALDQTPLRAAIVLGILAGLQTASAAFSTAPKDVVQ